MTLILPLGSLVQVHLEWLLPPLVPHPPPPILGDSGLGQLGQSLHLTLLPPKPLCRRPQSMVRLLGAFLGEILALPSKWFGTHQKNRAQNPCKTLYKQNPRKNPHKRSTVCILSKQGRGNQPPYRRYGPDTEIQYRPREPHGLAKTSRILYKKGSRYGISVSTPHRRYGHRLRTPFLRTPFPRLLLRSKDPCKKSMQKIRAEIRVKSGRKRAHKHKLFALVNIQMTLGQTAGCPRVNRAEKFMCSPRNTGEI